MQYDYTSQPNYNRTNYAEKRPTNTGLITEYRRVSQMVQNNVAAEKSRKTSRLSKGLNPDVPRPVNQSPGKFEVIQLLQRMKNKLKVKKLMKRHQRFKRWINTEYLWKNYAIDLEQILKQVYKTLFRIEY